MTSLFSQAQASPPPYTSPPSTPPPKRRRDQLLSPGGKVFLTHLFGSIYLQDINQSGTTK